MLKINSEPDLLRSIILSREEPVTQQQVEMMLHAIGADHKKERTYLGRKYYHAYRNYYDAGGSDTEQWEDLTRKGYAEKRRFYHVTASGLRLLELMTGAVIYDSYDCVGDCKSPMLTAFMKADVYCGHGCWFPTSVKDISESLKIPLALARKTARKLEEEGLIVKGHFGGITDEGYPYCRHGYYLTEKARKTERWEMLWRNEVEYIQKEVLT